MKKEGLAQRVYEAHGALTQREAAGVVDLILDIIKNTLQSGDIVKLSGFGILKVVTRKGRSGKHPKTGLPVEIRQRKTVVFVGSRTVSWEKKDGN